ncbi:unnamed protein product [Rhizophagus irregularis]|nr:unnamed protein product [Rhizophagus irregularis]
MPGKLLVHDKSQRLHRMMIQIGFWINIVKTHGLPSVEPLMWLYIFTEQIKSFGILEKISQSFLPDDLNIGRTGHVR